MRTDRDHPVIRNHSYSFKVKTCARCRERKSNEDFYANRGWSDGRHPYCKTCLLDYERDRRRQRLDRENPSRRRWSRDFVCHDYFAAIEQPVQAYVAGLLAADGNVLERQQRISLELSHRDRELVHLVRDQLAPGFPLRERVRKKGSRTVIFSITSRDVCCNLAQLGITPRKSLTLRWPENLDPRCERFFLLGYFDGDGFIMWSQSGIYRYARWGLLGTHAFLSEAMRVIAASTQVRMRIIRRLPEQQLYLLQITGRDAWTVDRWLHGDGKLGLARKRLVAKSRDASAA